MTKTLWLALLSQDLRRTFSYRVNFWLQFFTQTIGEIAVAYFLWKAIFLANGVETIGGYTLGGMVNYYIFVALAGRLIRGREQFLVSTEIYEGGLTRYLLYPVGYFHFKLTEHTGFLFLAILQVVLGVVVLGSLFPSDAGAFLKWDHLLLGFLASITASYFYFLLLISVELVSFWADNVWSLSVMMRFIVAFLGGLILPLSLFPDWATDLLVYSPFPALGSIPVRLFIGDANWMDFVEAQLLLLVWLVPLHLTLKTVWSRGVRQYTGVGQ
jgi:ABC-2 type transport system permease protein